MICGGIDLGGTKIEARLFDGPEVRTVEMRRVPTPKDSYASLLDQLGRQIEWLTDQTGMQDMPIGIAVPGILNAESGMLFAANVTASDHAIRRDLENRFGREFTMINDCMAFALSEANGGAADQYHTVMGLILGTGVGGGICSGGRLMPRHGAIAVEIGHVPIPARAVQRHGLPLWPCGCGQLGCLETCVSGTGLSNIAQHKLGRRLSAETLVAEGHQDCLDIWADIAGECLVIIQLTLAPDCIVLGGGLSNMPDVAAILQARLAHHALQGMALPNIVVAQHGDSSGARGAALLAAQA